MTALQMSLTDKALEKLPLAPDGQYVVRDTELKGFLVVIGKRRKTFTVKGEGWQNGRRRNVYAAIGLVGEIPARDARLKAKEALTRIAKGLPAIEPAEADKVPEALADTPTEAVGVTLWEAWERYLESHLVRKKRGARTIASYTDHVERIFKAWRDLPLKVLGEDPSLVATRHDDVTRENGPYIANGAMRTLRAIYNHARKAHRYLPADNPVDAIDWNEETRRDTGMGLKALPGWFDEVLALDNPLRREFHLFTLLSGCRPGALRVAEISHLNFARRILHIPAPKGGAKKAFDIPLSRPMIRCLIRAIRLGRQMHPDAAERWIFAAGSREGHLVEQKEDREVLSKWGNDLRQTFRTVGQAAEVSPLDIHILMNHALQGVNSGYITKSALIEDHLRRQQERISTTVLQAVEAGRGRRRDRVLTWLRSSKVDALAVDGGAWQQALRLDQSSGEGHAGTMVGESPGEEPAEQLGIHGPVPRRQADITSIKVKTWAGEVAGSTRLEREFGISRSTLHGWQKQNRAVALLTGARKCVFQLAQFIDGRPVEGLAEIVAAAGSPRNAWLWLVKPNPALGVRAPLDRLKTGDVSTVTGLAMRDFGQP